jgi:hypothetical protein
VDRLDVAAIVRVARGGSGVLGGQLGHDVDVMHLHLWRLHGAEEIAIREGSIEALLHGDGVRASVSGIPLKELLHGLV